MRATPTFVQCLIGHPVYIAATALWHQPFHDHVHTALSVGAPDTATGKEGNSEEETSLPTPWPPILALPYLVCPLTSVRSPTLTVSKMPVLRSQATLRLVW